MVVLVPASAAELLDLFAVTLRDSLSSSALWAIAEEYGKQHRDPLEQRFTV